MGQYLTIIPHLSRCAEPDLGPPRSASSGHHVRPGTSPALPARRLGRLPAILRVDAHELLQGQRRRKGKHDPHAHSCTPRGHGLHGTLAQPKTLHTARGAVNMHAASAARPLCQVHVWQSPRPPTGHKHLLLLLPCTPQVQPRRGCQGYRIRSE
jgi:hypothetical protein